MAGSSFLVARSPVTPNRTSTQGPATRGMRRSRGSRSGLGIIAVLRSSAVGRSSSPAALVGQLGLDGVQQLVPRGRELLDALVLQHLDHVVVADADGLEVLEVPPGGVVSAMNGVAAHVTVVG